MTSAAPVPRTLTGMAATTTTRWAARRSLAFDVVLAGALTLFFGFASVAQAREAGLFAVAQLAPLVWRRTHPALVFTACTWVAVLQWLVGVDLHPGNIGLLFALYAVAVYGKVAHTRIALAVGGLGVLMAVSRYYDNVPWRQQFTVTVALAAVVFGVWAFGERRRTRTLYVAQLEERAAQLEHDRDQEAKLAVSAERTRIAREIHDVLAHSLGALSIEIQVARALLADHQDTAGALDRLAGAQRMAADGLADTRRAVYDVRGDTAPLPQELADMTGTHEERHGTPAMLAVCGQRQPLSPDLTLSLVRVAQECLTNAAKHAPGRPLAVELRYEGHQVTLTISNPLDERLGGTPEKRRHHGVGHTESTVDSVAFATVDGGYGLLGMRERLLLLGGGLTAGVEAGRWVVRAQAPL